MIAVGGLSLNVQEAGPPDGPPLILLHGFPESARAWRKTLRPLGERGFRVLAPDMRGYGESDVPPGIETYHLDLLVADVIGLADSIDAQTFAPRQRMRLPKNYWC